MALALSREDSIYLETVTIYDEVNTAPAGIETNIITYTVPSGEVQKLRSVIIGGNDNAEFFVRINSSNEIKVRNAWTDRTKEKYLGDKSVFGGDVITVSVFNKGTQPNSFESTLILKKL